MRKTHILVVDDDPAILRFLCANLRARDYEVTVASDGEEALEAIQSDFVDLMILDIMMPKLDGVEVCRRVREWSHVPVIILSARGDEKDKVKCLELGADDYLTKPFGVAELLARIKTALRHADASRHTLRQPTFTCGGLEINFDMRRVTVDGTEVRLTPTEYSLLQQLASNAGKVLTHSMLLQKVWGDQYYSEKEYLRVFIGRLRHKIEPEPENPRYIMTDPGVGYHLAVAEAVC
jgi:two-component system KDP operon response regulator KdpE